MEGDCGKTQPRIGIVCNSDKETGAAAAKAWVAY